MIQAPISNLPDQVSDYAAIEAVYGDQLFRIVRHVRQGRSMIVRTVKHLHPFLTSILRKKFPAEGLTLQIIDGSVADPNAMMAPTRAQAMVQQFTEAVRTQDKSVVFVVPYLDILTSARAGATQEAREILTLIHENPRVVLLAYEDPAMPLPELVVQAFFSIIEMIGTPRVRLSSIITQEEAHRFGTDHLNVRDLARFFSGKSPYEIRRIMAYFAEQTPLEPGDADTYRQRIRELRELTVSGDTGLSTVNLHNDIAGYAPVKQQIEDEILSLLAVAQSSTDEKTVARIEELLPRGLILSGPPGTGKTLFARGIAEAIQGTVHVVNGPELKSRYVGESESNIRRLFARARANAPAVIVFDELDSIAGKRESESTSNEGGARSIVNQLLTEMDGFRREELVFVVGTTNMPDLLDPALLRPGRFGLSIEVGYPGTVDREEILRLYNRTLDINLGDQALKELVLWTGRNTRRATPFAGDDIRALMYALRRWMLREDRSTVPLEDMRRWLREQAVRGGDQDGLQERVPGLEDIAGYQGLKEHLDRVLLNRIRLIGEARDVTHRQRLERLVPRGILLHGPPGTGKTHIARALAGAAGYRPIFVSGPELKSKWFGGSEERVRELFARARSNAPAAIILDELDSVADARGDGSDRNSSIGEGLLLQILSELTRLEPHDQILVIATTNRPERVDPALLRPGRIGTHIQVGYPDAGDRQEILQFFLRETGLELEPTALRTLVEFSGGITSRGTPYSADDLRDLVSSVAASCPADASVTVSQITKFLESHGGSRRMEPPDLERIAVHEIGHVCSAILDGAGDQVLRVTLAAYANSTSGALGTAEFSRETRPFETEADVRREIRGLLAATITEELVYGNRSSGCAGDLRRATELAERLVTHYAMSEHPTLRSFVDDQYGIAPAEQSRVNAYVDSILAEEEAAVRDRLTALVDAIRLTAMELVRELTMEGDRVRVLLEERGVRALPNT